MCSQTRTIWLRPQSLSLAGITSYTLRLLFRPSCLPPTNCSGGSLSDFLATDCENSDPFDHSDFVWSDTCTGNAIYESEKPLGCWLTDNWDAMVAANGIPGESRLAIIAGPYSVNFTLNGLLCMNSWFDLLEDYAASPLSASFNVDGDYPDCDPDLAPDLVTMGGGPMLMVLAAKLNLLRDRVLQDGEGLMRGGCSHSGDTLGRVLVGSSPRLCGSLLFNLCFLMSWA